MEGSAYPKCFFTTAWILRDSSPQNQNDILALTCSGVSPFMRKGCLPSLEYNETRWHLACEVPKKNLISKTKTKKAMFLFRDDDPVTQDDPQSWL